MNKPHNANAQTKACKRVCFAQPTDNKLEREKGQQITASKRKLGFSDY